jgi:hypothetical protein
MLLPYLFSAALDFSSSPFGLELPSSAAFFTSPGHVRCPKPVAVFQAQSSQTSIQLLLPFGTFIPPDRSAQSAARSEKLAFVSGPFSLRSPQASIIFNNYPLTDHRSCGGFNATAWLPLAMWAQYLCTFQPILHVHRAACYGLWSAPTCRFRNAPRLKVLNSLSALLDCSHLLWSWKDKNNFG